MIKNIIKYVLMMLVVVIGSLYFESYELLYLTILLVCLPVINIIVINYSIKKINIEYDINTSITNKGKNIPIRLKINNGGIIPVIWIEIKFRCTNNYHLNNSELSLVFPILRYGKQEYSFNVKSEYCGDLDINFKTIKYMDYFKLYYRKKKIDKNVRVYVLPQVGNIDDIRIEKRNILDIDGEKYSEIKPGDDPSQIFDMREYRKGDKLHSVHWKLSAKKSKIMVKENSLPLNGYYSVIMDLSCEPDKSKSDIIDAITQIALSIIIRLQQEEINHYLIGCERGSKVCYKDIIENDMTLEDTIHELYKSCYSTNTDILECIENNVINQNESQIYFITSNLNKSNINKLGEVYSNVYRKIIAIVDRKNIDTSIIDYAYENDVDINIIDIDNIEASMLNITL